jgi:DNA-binding transcriptional regulator PaaX
VGKIETEIKKRVRKENLRKILLSSVAVAGVLGVAVLAPNALQVLGQLGLIERGQHTRNSNLSRSMRRLLKNQSLKFQNAPNGKKYLTITEEGRRRLNTLEARDFNLKKPKHWDRKWRVIIFDIGEKQRRTRDQLRITLGKIGFVKLQKSVWVYPYDCEDLVMLWKANVELGRNLLYLVVDEIEDDKWLKKLFGLRV